MAISSTASNFDYNMDKEQTSKEMELMERQIVLKEKEIDVKMQEIEAKHIENMDKEQ